jgi:hypothetical protein
MTSKIKVDNIENQCGGAVVTKCGGTTTISGTVVKSNALQASDAGNIISQSGTTITLGASGDSINLASGATQSGFGRTGTVDWQTGSIKTSTFAAGSGEGYFCNTAATAFTVNLPAGSAGAIVSLADYAATWQTNNLTIAPNGSEKIGGIAASQTLDTEGQSVTFVFVDSTQGWINTMDSTSNVRGNPNLVASVTGACNTLVTAPCCANVKIATFTGPGSFIVCSASQIAANNTIGYMIIAGGGGGGAGDRNGGGGAGGFREGRNTSVDNFTSSPLVANAPTNAVTVTAQSYPIVVGGGGAGGVYACGGVNGVKGGNSSFDTITSTGGGYGGGNELSDGGAGGPGGSGGGGGIFGLSNGQTGPNAAGNTPPVSPSQGNQGGSAQYITNAGSGGGGGSGAAGQNAVGPAPGRGGDGGAGVSSSITGSSVTRGGGGGGAGDQGPRAGGAGGGGAAGPPGGPAGVSGTANTGGGGGNSGLSTSSNGDAGGSGGSGIVIIRYKFQ